MATAAHPGRLSRVVSMAIIAAVRRGLAPLAGSPQAFDRSDEFERRPFDDVAGDRVDRLTRGSPTTADINWLCTGFRAWSAAEGAVQLERILRFRHRRVRRSDQVSSLIGLLHLANASPVQRSCARRQRSIWCALRRGRSNGHGGTGAGVDAARRSGGAPIVGGRLLLAEISPTGFSVRAETPLRVKTTSEE